MNKYKMKEQYSDFQVSEIIDLNLSGGDYHYYLLHKCGIRTVEAIKSICIDFEINENLVSYAGLKDEDAITSQFISIYGKKIDNKSYIGNNGGYYHINYVGSAEYGIKIGYLHGNAFKITIRDLNRRFAEKIVLYRKHLMPIINYYGIQRFGKPSMPKLTHLIGEALIAGDQNVAFEYMYRCGNLTEEMFGKWKNHCDEYFTSLPLRELNFYLSAWDSYLWNKSVMQIIDKSASRFENIYQDDIQYMFTVLDMDISEKLQTLGITRHTFNDEYKIISHDSFRQPYIPVIYHVSDIKEDDLHIGKYKLQLSFTLPSGSYATTAVDQILWNIKQR